MLVEWLSYEQKQGLCAVSSPNLNTSQVAIILVGGMTDGPFSLPYSEHLHERCLNNNVALLQPILLSSYRQFGFSSLDTDAKNLTQLINSLKQQTVILVGHSTGCNGIVHLLSHQQQLDPKSDIIARVAGIVLQGPVSDREYLAHLLGKEKFAYYSNLSKKMISNAQADSIMPYEAFPMDPIIPITAGRFQSLLYGDDDIFSTDLELGTSPLFRVKTPMLILLSKEDEYIPPHINSDTIYSFFKPVLNLNDRNKIILFDGGANHNLSTISGKQVADSILHWINSLGIY